MNSKIVFTLSFLIWSSCVSAYDFSALAPYGITISNTSESADYYEIKGIASDNSTVGVFMENINRSNIGTADLKKLVLNPDGQGKYFEMMVLKDSYVAPIPDTTNNKNKLHDAKYNVHVVVKNNYFQINDSRYYNQVAIKEAFANKKNLKLVICKEKDATDKALHELLNTFSQLNTLGMDVLPGSVCN